MGDADDTGPKGRAEMLANAGIVGNGQITALVQADGEVSWCCWPRPDGDPIFCSLLGSKPGWGTFSISLVDQTACELRYQRNTAILESIAHDARGNAIRITTWCPRYMRRGRLFRPPMLIRRIEPLTGRPYVRIHLVPAAGYGARLFDRQLGSHHVRYSDATQSLRVTTDAPVSHLTEQRVFVLERWIDLVLSDDETLGSPAHQIADETLRATYRYWHEWVRGLAIPYEWQEATIRAAITLQLCTYDDNGAVLAAPTTSIPEAARQRTQLGLSVLLAAGCVLHRAGDEPPGCHRCDGSVPALSGGCGRERARREPAAGLWDHWRARS